MSYNFTLQHTDMHYAIDDVHTTLSVRPHADGRIIVECDEVGPGFQDTAGIVVDPAEALSIAAALVSAAFKSVRAPLGEVLPPQLELLLNRSN